MFKVNQSENYLIPLERKLFNDLKLQERSDLQEWLAQTPEALGEDLLVIQKEFDGFADTRERLDLLALDKEGRLVVIENKLDDSGRDVVWQALKYVAYCSSLKKAEIVEVYQKYLDRWFGGQNAVANLCEFLDVEDLDDTVLNAGNEQRLILVAANFRKEVTATALWLIGHGIRAQCFRILPYSLGEKLLIDSPQIIPTPEAADYMIGIAAKEHWLASATGVSGCGYNLIFSKKEARVELNLARAEASENKWIFDQFEQKKQEIEDCFGSELHWQRLDEKKASRISLTQPFDGFSDENWPAMIDWLCQHIVKLEGAFTEPLTHLNKQLKSRTGISGDYQGVSH